MGQGKSTEKKAKPAAQTVKGQVRAATFFNMLPRDVCRGLIASHLNPGEIEAVLKTSASMRHAFEGSRLFQIMKDASEVLQEVMSADFAGVDIILSQFKEEYGDDFWKLLVVRTRGTEERGTKWEAVSAIEFAVYAGDFSDDDAHGYMLNRLLELIPIEHRHIAVAQMKQIKEHGSVQFGIKRGVLSAVTDLGVIYNLYARLSEDISMSASAQFWRDEVVPYQEKLPENVLREYCRPLLWQPMMGASFLTLPPPPPAAKVDGGGPFDSPFLVFRNWGICHGNHFGAVTAINERGSGIGSRDVLNDRDRLQLYSMMRMVQLTKIITRQERLIAELEDSKLRASFKR